MTTKQYEMKADRIREIYEAMLDTQENDKLRCALVDELLKMQQSDGSWSVIDTRQCDSDIRVYYIYYPTYYATAALMYADFSNKYSDASDEKRALMKGLEVAAERKLMGHGFDATRQMLEALNIYKSAGLYQWINLGENAKGSFASIIHERVAIMKDAIKSGNTISDWNVDFTEDYEREILDYDSVSDSYVWYACYGSNVNKARFMKYIDRCTDKTAPIEDRPYRFKHNIYFAKKASTWHGGGKAFLDSTITGEAYGRIYKIKQAQFEEIMRAEGSDYSKLLKLGEVQGVPVYSFTDTQKNEASVPSDDYYETILEGLVECYEGIYSRQELNTYLINRVFPSNTFAVVRAIRKNPHYMSNQGISSVTGLRSIDVIESIAWLLEQKVIRMDSRSIRAGDKITDKQASFYTVEGHCGRGLIETILKNI